MSDQEDVERNVQPVLYSSSIALAVSSTDIKVTFNDSTPAVNDKGEAVKEDHQVALIAMSFHTAKDLFTVLGTSLADIEGRLGQIDTPYLQGLKKPRDESEDK